MADAKEKSTREKKSVPQVLPEETAKRASGAAEEKPVRLAAPEEKFEVEKASAESAEPPLDDPFADGPPLEQMAGIEEAEAREAHVPEPFDWGVEESLVSLAVYPDSAEFQQAVAALPVGIRTLLHDNFRAEFTVLREIPESRYLHLGAAPIKRAAEEIEEIDLGED